MDGIRFLEINHNDISDDPTYVASNNQDTAENAFDRDPWTRYISSGATSDLTQVTLEAQALVEKESDTLILINHNLDSFTYQYYSGTMWVDVLSETGYSGTTYYSKHSSFTASRRRLVMGTTIISNSEKELQSFISTKEIGQLNHYPEIRFENDRNVITKDMINGRPKLVYNRDAHIVNLNFKSYINSDDRDLFMTLWNTYQPFLVWLCGGDPSQFTHTDIGYRFDDIYLCGFGKPYKHNYTKNIYLNGMNVNIVLYEVS